MIEEHRLLKDLQGVGKACLKDFAALGINTVDDLSKSNPEKLYQQLSILSGSPQDICVLDVLRCAVAQAQNPQLPEVEKNWWYWSQKRKEQQ
jgi:hypothetical protein